MSANNEKAVELVCSLFVGLGFAMCHADGVLKREEGQALAKALNALLDEMGAGKGLRDQVPGMLTRASKQSSRHAGAEAAKARVAQLIEMGQQLPARLQALMLNSLAQIAKSDGELHDLEQALMAQIEVAWGVREAAAADGDAAGGPGPASDHDYMFAAIHAWVLISVVDGDQAAEELEAAMRFAVVLGAKLGMEAGEVVSDKLMEVFLSGAVQAQVDTEDQLASFVQHLQVLADAPREVRKHVMTGLAVIALKDGEVVSGEAALLAIAQKVLGVSLAEVAGKEQPSEEPSSECPAAPRSAEGPVTLPSAEALRALRARLDEEDALIEHWWMADPARQDRIKPTYAWAVGRPALCLEDSSGRASVCVSWNWIEKLTYEQLVLGEVFVLDGMKARTFCDSRSEIYQAFCLGENGFRAVSFRGGAHCEGGKPGYASGLAHLALSHEQSQVAPGAYAERGELVEDNFMTSIDYLHEEPRIRRIVVDGELKALVVGIAAADGSGPNIEGVPAGEEDMVTAVVATDDAPHDLAQLELFASLYARMQRRYGVPFRGSPSMPTPHANYTFKSLGDWAALDVEALPDRHAGSISAEEMKAIQQDVYDRAHALQFACQR